MLNIPKGATKLRMRVKFRDPDGKKRVAEMKIGANEIGECRKMYLELDPYDNAFAVFSLTDKGMAFLDGEEQDA